MYSDNDFRNYSELYHASAFGKGGFVNGKNTPEYNKWYYMTHPEKWGITKAAQNAGKKLEEMAKNTETDLDDNLLAGAQNLLNKGKNAVANNSVVKDVRKSTEAMQRRDDANRSASKHRAQQQEYQSKADRASANARAVANNPYISPSAQAEYNRQAKMYSQAAAGSGRMASNYERTASINDSASRGYANRAINRVKNNVTDTVKGAPGAVVGAVKSTGNKLKDAVNTAINNSDTKIDDNLRAMASNLVKGNSKEAGYYGRSAVNAAKREGKQAFDTARNNATNTAGVVRNNLINAGGVVRNTAQNIGGVAKNTLNNAIDRSKTDVDNKLRDVYRAYKSGDEGAVKDAWKRAGDQTIRELNPVINTGYRVANKIADATGLTARRQAESARQRADELTNQASEYRESANRSRAEELAARDRGDRSTAKSALEDSIAKNREAEILEGRAGAMERVAQSKYNATPLGKIENAANKLKNAISGTYNRAANAVSSKVGEVGESVEARKAAMAEVTKQMDAYYDIVSKYGSDDPRAIRALQRADNVLNSKQVGLLNNFANAQGTVENVIEFGQNWIDNLMDQAADVRRRTDLYVDTRRNIDQEEGRRRQGRG